jgi:hypothetical protein
MASDRRARGGGVIDTLAEANGSVLAAQWGEAAKEHGCDVLGWWLWAEMGGSAYVWWGKNGEITPRVKKYFLPAILFPNLSSKIRLISLGGLPLESQSQQLADPRCSGQS